VDRDLRSNIQENETVGEDGLGEVQRNQRPDMMVERRTGGPTGGKSKIFEITEFSCPYGYLSQGADSLGRVNDQKKRKYAELARKLKRIRREEVGVTAVIVSSMGAVYGPSLKNLQKILKCNDRELRTLGWKISETVRMGSMEIWCQNTRLIDAGTREKVNDLIREEPERTEQSGVAIEGEAETGAEVGMGIEADAEAEAEAEAEGRNDQGFGDEDEYVEEEEEPEKRGEGGEFERVEGAAEGERVGEGQVGNEVTVVPEAGRLV
jgi:hypothetical protein